MKDKDTDKPAEKGEPKASPPDASDEAVKDEPVKDEESSLFSSVEDPVEVMLSGPVFVQKIKKKKKKKKKKDKKKEQSLGTSRGIETMFRTSYRTHMDLSSIADGKANIMISINGLIISIILAAVAPQLIESPWLAIPTSTLLLTCLVSIVYAVLCARPRVSSASVSLEDVRSDRANILFFGNFVNMPRDDYELGMTELMLDSDRLYHNMIRDLYGLGLVLQKKFRLLRVAYTVFMIGLVISVLLFIGAFIYESYVTI